MPKRKNNFNQKRIPQAKSNAFGIAFVFPGKVKFMFLEKLDIFVNYFNSNTLKCSLGASEYDVKVGQWTQLFFNHVQTSFAQ